MVFFTDIGVCKRANMHIQQLKTGYLDNFSYIIGCETTHAALVIDPAGDVSQIADSAKTAGFTIQNIVNTHGHGDHTAGNAPLKAFE